MRIRTLIKTRYRKSMRIKINEDENWITVRIRGLITIRISKNQKLKKNDINKKEYETCNEDKKLNEN